MKRLLTVSLTLFLATGLAACGKKGELKPPADYHQTQ